MHSTENTETGIVIQRLIETAQKDFSLAKLITASLLKAQTLAKERLDPALYKALDWPTDFEMYIAYLMKYAKWVPHESGEAVWLTPGTDGHQEVDDRLNHFYWLIDQKTGEHNSKLVENNPWFKKWLVDYANAWGSFLNTPQSFSPTIQDSFLTKAPLYRVGDSLIDGKSNNPSGWLTFNQFFARELNPGLRPVSSPEKNTVVTSPADCNFKAQYAIAADSSIPEITLKMKHKFVTIPHLLQGSKYAHAFAGGNLVHYYLSPFSYHRFHTPVAGKVLECFPVNGLVYMDVTITDKQFDSPDNSEDGYEFNQARGILILDTSHSPYGDIGLVAVIPVGMCQVSSVSMIATPGSNLQKGEQFGYFMFGGSDIMLVYQAGIHPKIDTTTDYRLYGTPIAQCSLKGKS
jgi:phosphatidylserine decarboxylase